MRTARAIREALQGQGQVYLRELMGAHARRIFDARERKGQLEVKLADGWYEVLIGDDIWSTGY